MGRARCAQAAWAFGVSGNGAARLPIEMGQTCGNKNNQARDSPMLDRDCELHGVIALLAFERARVETRLSRLNAGKSHRLAAFGPRENADICDTEQ
jgi:hypothetical protein